MFSNKIKGPGLTSIGLSLITLALTAASVNAQPSDDGQQGGSASTSGGPGPKGLRRGKAGGAMGGHHMHFPKAEDVLSVPGLTAKQKTDIQALYDQEKNDLAPLRKQAKAAGLGAGRAAGAATEAGGKAAATAGGAGAGAGMQVLQQIHSVRKATWEKVKPLLSEQQLATLKPGGGPGGPGPGAPMDTPPGSEQ